MDLKLVIEILQLLVLSIIPIILFFRTKKQNSESEEFKITFNCLDSILSSYKKFILQPKINILMKDHDLDPTSKTNAISTFNQKKEELIKEAVNDIFKSYVNKTTIASIEQYYTRDGLLLFILTYFRG